MTRFLPLVLLPVAMATAACGESASRTRADWRGTPGNQANVPGGPGHDPNVGPGNANVGPGNDGGPGTNPSDKPRVHV